MPAKRICFLFVIMMMTTHWVMGQQDSSVYKGSKKMKSKESRSRLNSSSVELEKSISSNESNDKIAEDYYTVGSELVKKGDYMKAEVYFQKAVDQALLSKKGNQYMCTYYRELAKVQEGLKKINEAISNFKKAASCTDDEVLKQVNTNDAERLQVPPEKELQLLDKNAEILTKGDYKFEQAQNYTQQANTNKRLNKPEAAIKNYEKALKVLDSTTDLEESNEIKSNIADLLAEKKQYAGAIDVQQQVVIQAEGTYAQAQQLRKLSAIYFASKNMAEGLKALQESYKLSVERGNLKEAEASLNALEKFYINNGQTDEVLPLYRGFLRQLDTLIAKDSSLVDSKLFQFSEAKIAQLEKEKALKDELLERKNTNNTILLISVVLLLVLILIIAKAWHSIRQRNKQIALQSLRREMNPHFLFNSLNSVNQFIASNNEREANKYLTSYSNLMRTTMENSNTNFVPLALELDQITKYLDLEKLRFSDKFDYHISVDPQLDENTVMVPNMIIQPNLENAIWHGLRYRDSKGSLSVRFSKEGKKAVVWVEDNGIGLTESKRIKTENQKLYESRGLKNVQERIRLLNELGSSQIVMEIKEKTGNETGVLVKIAWEQ